MMLKVLRTLSGVLFVEPSRELYMQDEVHDRARQLLQQRGLPADHPYIGWHAQANGFDGKGQLHGAQRIYFDGSHEVVGRALAALEAKGFAVRGGLSVDEAFVAYHDATPEQVDNVPEQIEA